MIPATGTPAAERLRLRSQPAARRYARGALEAALRFDLADPVGGELAAAAEILAPLGSLDEPARAGQLDLEALQAALAEAAHRAGFGRLTAGLLALLARRRDLDLLPLVASEYATELDRYRGRATARVLAAAPLTGAERSRLAAALGRLTGLELTLEEQPAPELLGGLIARVGDLRVDGSLRTRLRRIRHRLAWG